MSEKVKIKIARNVVHLPAIALRGLVVFPNNVVHFEVGRTKSIAAIEAAMHANSSVFLVAQREMDEEEPALHDLYAYGVIAEIKQVLRVSDDLVKVLVEGKTRARLLELDAGEKYLQATVRPVAVRGIPADKRNQVEALVRSLKDCFEEYLSYSPQISKDVVYNIVSSDSPLYLSEYMPANLLFKYEDKQVILNESTLLGRLEKLLTLLRQECQIMDIERDLDDKVNARMDKGQREYYLREQMNVISEELGDAEDTRAEADTYRGKVKALNLDEESTEKLLKECDRLARMQGSSAESGVIRSYLDACLALPWHTATEDDLDQAHARKVLDREHYGLQKVKERILDFLAVHQLVPDKNAPILCLVGPPGVGKTSLAASVARATGRQFIRASLGGVRDEAEIRGHRRTYVGAMPGRIIEGIRNAGTRNPVFLLDEVDKLAADYRGDPSSALLEVLDPAQNKAFSDHYIDIPFDLSKVFWIVTANNLGTIPRPLRDRMEIIELSSYTEYEKLEIAKRYLVGRQREQNGLSGKDIRFGAGVLQDIVEHYTRESGVRELERLIGQVCRKAARKIVEGEEPPIRVTRRNLTDFLGRVKFLETKSEKKPQVGVATGMAWTEVGGAILPTEVTVLKGKGKLILTGQLGDVMQESAQAALSYIRSRADALGLPEDFYEKDDIHIHLPEGAVPKDGPSAGITMATAMISALTGRKVHSDVAMTGEITLRGNVLPIGGLKEKVLAAYREGMKTIVLPKKNARDIEEIPESVREKLTFVPASHMDEVLKTALLPADRPAKQETEVPDEKAPAKKDETGANASSTESGQGGDNDA